MSKPVTLLTDSGNTAGKGFPLTQLDALRHQNVAVYIWGTWGGATAKVQISPDGENWFDFASNSITANGVIEVPYNAQSIQIVISGGGTTPAPSLNAVAI